MIHTMKPNKSFEIDLLRRRNTPVSELLRVAVEAGEINDEYQPLEPRRESETDDEYIARVREFSLRAQFVNVALHGATKFVSFGVPGPIATPFAKFEMIPAQVLEGAWGTHYCLFYPDLKTVLETAGDVFLRLDSGCTSGQVFGDSTCDCKQQLEIAFLKCAEYGRGVVINIPNHDGRGWGEFKMANQKIMDELDLDTVDVARRFYGNESSIDQRSFDEAVALLLAFGFNDSHKFQLGTNNPRKVGAFHAMGLKLAEVEPIVSDQLNDRAQKNFDAKKSQWGHTLH